MFQPVWFHITVNIMLTIQNHTEQRSCLPVNPENQERINCSSIKYLGVCYSVTNNWNRSLPPHCNTAYQGYQWFSCHQIQWSLLGSYLCDHPVAFLLECSFPLTSMTSHSPGFTPISSSLPITMWANPGGFVPVKVCPLHVRCLWFSVYLMEGLLFLSREPVFKYTIFCVSLEGFLGTALPNPLVWQVQLKLDILFSQPSHPWLIHPTTPD